MSVSDSALKKKKREKSKVKEGREEEEGRRNEASYIGSELGLEEIVLSLII